MLTEKKKNFPWWVSTQLHLVSNTRRGHMYVYSVHFQPVMPFFLTMAKFTSENVSICLRPQSSSLWVPWDFIVCRHSTRPSRLGFPHHCSASWRSVNLWKPKSLSCPQHHLYLMVKILSLIFSRYEKPNLEFLPINILWPCHQRVFLVFLFIELALLTEDHSKYKILQNTEVLTFKRFKLCHKELSKLGPRMIYFAYWVISFLLQISYQVVLYIDAWIKQSSLTN